MRNKEVYADAIATIDFERNNETLKSRNDRYRNIHDFFENEKFWKYIRDQENRGLYNKLDVMLSYYCGCDETLYIDGELVQRRDVRKLLRKLYLEYALKNISKGAKEKKKKIIEQIDEVLGEPYDKPSTE